MTKKYRHEKFKNLDETIRWCLDDKSIVDHDGDVLHFTSINFNLRCIKDRWQDWKKAIEIEEPKLRKLWRWEYQMKGNAPTPTEGWYCEEFRDANGYLYDPLRDARWKRKVESSVIVVNEKGEVV